MKPKSTSADGENNTSETLDGMLYEVALFSVALSEEDINTLMNAGTIVPNGC